MPEFAETYHQIKYLHDADIFNRKIIDVDVKHKNFDGLKWLVGKTLKTIYQKGKYHIWQLDDNQAMIWHMRFTGMFEVKDQAFWFVRSYRASFRELPTKNHPDTKPPYDLLESDTPYTPKSARAIINFEGDKELIYYDRRCLGKYYIIEQVQEKYEVQNIPDYPNYLFRAHLRIHKTLFKQKPDWLQTAYSLAVHDSPVAPANEILEMRGLVKTVFLAQDKIAAGAGNYVVCEAMFRAGIHPTLRIEQLTLVPLHNMRQSIIDVILLGVKTGADYNVPGLIQVFRRKKCPKGHEIERLKQANRGTYFCPICQDVKNAMTHA